MRTLIVGALAATLAGCSCYLTPQSGLEACAGADGLACLDKDPGARRWTAPEPSSPAASTATPEKAVRPKAPMKRLSAHSGGKTHQTREAEKSVAKAEPAAVGQPEAIDPVADKARIAVSLKLEDPKSATFSDMNDPCERICWGNPSIPFAGT